MNANIENDEKWMIELANKLPNEQLPPTPEPDQDTRNIAWQTNERYRNTNEEFEPFVLAAAACPHSTPEKLVSQGKQWYISWEEVDGEDTHVYFQFKCNAEFLDNYTGRTVDAQLGDEVFDLGVIDQFGVTERKIERHFIYHNPINIRIRPRR